MTETVRFDKRELHFCASPNARLGEAELEFPLSVSLQVTRNCNLDCEYCSEVGNMPIPSIATIEKMLSNLRGVRRIIITGGEPLTRHDLVETADLARKLQFETVSLATNGVLITSDLARRLVSLVDYADVTIDGPRKIHNKIRGKYDEVIKGIRMLRNAGVPFSIVSVLFRQNAESILYTCQIADVLEATQLKIVTPISKGRGNYIAKDRLSSSELSGVFRRIRSEKARNGWAVRITLTDWSKVGEGHALLVHPNGDVVASPVPSKENCVQELGNILKENIEEIWARYPYKRNHMRKYIEKTLYVC